MSNVQNPNSQSREIDKRYFSSKDVSIAAAGAIQQEFFNEQGPFQAGTRNGNITTPNKISGGRFMFEWVKLLLRPDGFVNTALDSDIAQVIEILAGSNLIIRSDRDDILDMCPIEFFSGQSIQQIYQATAVSVAGLEIPFGGVKIPLEAKTILPKDSTINATLYATNPTALAGRSMGLTLIMGGRFRFGE